MDNFKETGNHFSSYQALLISKIKKDSLNLERKQSSAYEVNDEINNEELQTSLDKIDFNFDSTKTNNDKVEPLKEFWD